MTMRMLGGELNKAARTDAVATAVTRARDVVMLPPSLVSAPVAWAVPTLASLDSARNRKRTESRLIPLQWSHSIVTITCPPGHWVRSIAVESPRSGGG